MLKYVTFNNDNNNNNLHVGATFGAVEILILDREVSEINWASRIKKGSPGLILLARRTLGVTRTFGLAWTGFAWLFVSRFVA